MDYSITRSEEYLIHYGVKGQKWGIRRYQNEDGTLTEEGRKHAEKMSKWYDSKTGQKEIKRFEAAGKTASDAYKAHRQKRAGTIGQILGGIGANIIGQVVSTKRYEAGREFFDNYINTLKELDSYGLGEKYA